MTTMDLTISSIIGGVVIALIVGLNFFMSNSNTQFKTELTVQQSMADFKRLLQYDFDRIGYRDTTGTPVLTAKSDTLVFLGDVDDNGSVNRVSYFKASAAQRTGTANPNDFLVYRIVAPTDTTRINVNLTNFQFTYYDSTGATTTNASKVRGIKITAQLESANVQVNDAYAGVAWENMFYPRNLNIPK
jgi:hypothetical protein